MTRIAAMFFVVAIGLPRASAVAAEPVNVAQEAAKINAEFQQALSKGQRYDRKIYAEADAVRKAALAVLVARAERAGSQEHAALASVYRSLQLYDEAATSARAAIAAGDKSPAVRSTLVVSLCYADKPDQAALELEAALKALPEQHNLSSLRQTLSLAYQRAGKFDKAAEQSALFVESLLPAATDREAARRYGIDAPSLLANAVGQLTELSIRGRRVAETLPLVEKLVTQTRDAAAADATLGGLAADVRQSHVRLLVAAERRDEAARLIQGELAELEKNNAPDAKTITAVAELKRLQLQLAGFGPERVAAVDDYYEYLASQWEMAKNASRYVQLAGDAAQQKVQTLMQAEKLEEADKLLGAWQVRLKDIKTTDMDVQGVVPSVLNGLNYLRGRLDGDLKRRALVGKPYVPIVEAVWLNGSPLKPEELRGKVVLLDFWAVWCGPCITTFPHLREWQEKYADKGLVVIGVTKRYGYGWDDDAKHGKPQDGISPADEDKATTEFVKHHQLKHRIAVVPDSELSQKYLVTGIPQAVLIDRDGSIRMIKVGSSKENAAALEQMIRRLTGASEQAAN